MQQKKSELLRHRIETEKGLWHPLCYDCVSARVFAGAGADVIAVSGYGVSMGLLGLPDMGFVSLPELVMVTRAVVDCVDVPVIADTDTGFGNALSVLRTTREIIQTGAAAMLLEDQLAPKTCGHMAGKQVIPLEEALGKYRAAVEVRERLDPAFLIVARTVARGAVGGSLEEAIERVKAYLEVGADVAFVDGLPSEEELRRVVAEVNGPVVYNMVGSSPVIPLSTLKEIGVSLVSLGIAQWVAAKAMWDYAHDLASRGVEAHLEFTKGLEGHPLEEFHEFARFPEMKALEERFLPGEHAEREHRDTPGCGPS